jgi:hypothetical protein
LEGIKLSDDWLKAIGRVVVESSRLDRAAEKVIWGLLRLGHDDVGAALTTHISTPVRLDIILSLADILLDANETKRLAKLLKRIRGLLDDRNAVVHSEWVPFRNPLLVKVTARKRGVKRSGYGPTIPFLDTLAVDIGQVADELEKLRYKYDLELVGKWAARR